MFLSSRAWRVYAFEPNRHSYRVLRHFTKDRSNVSTFNVAVGSKEGVARLNIVDGEATSLGTSILKLDGLKYNKHVTVPMVRLDDLEFPTAPTVLVVDCEGYESEVLLGAKCLLEKIRTVFIETHLLSDGHDTLPEVLSEVARIPMKTDVLTLRDEPPWVCGTRQGSFV